MLTCTISLNRYNRCQSQLPTVSFVHCIKFLQINIFLDKRWQSFTVHNICLLGIYIYIRCLVSPICCTVQCHSWSAQHACSKPSNSACFAFNLQTCVCLASVRCLVMLLPATAWLCAACNSITRQQMFHTWLHS